MEYFRGRCWNASFVSYSTERQISKNPENFGKGEIKGVAGPESANNALGRSFCTHVSFRGSGSATTAVMLGAFLMLDIQAGPMLFIERPDVVWGWLLLFTLEIFFY